MDRDDTTEVNPAARNPAYVDLAVRDLHRKAELLNLEIERVRARGIVVHVGTTHRMDCEPMILVSAGGRRTPGDG